MDEQYDMGFEVNALGDVKCSKCDPRNSLLPNVRICPRQSVFAVVMEMLA